MSSIKKLSTENYKENCCFAFININKIRTEIYPPFCTHFSTLATDTSVSILDLVCMKGENLVFSSFSSATGIVQSYDRDLLKESVTVNEAVSA